MESVYYLRVWLRVLCSSLGRAPGERRGSAVACRDPQKEAGKAGRIMGQMQSQPRRTWGSRKQTFPFRSALSFVCLY